MHAGRVWCCGLVVAVRLSSTLTAGASLLAIAISCSCVTVHQFKWLHQSNLSGCLSGERYVCDSVDYNAMLSTMVQSNVVRWLMLHCCCSLAATHRSEVTVCAVLGVRRQSKQVASHVRAREVQTSCQTRRDLLSTPVPVAPTTSFTVHRTDAEQMLVRTKGTWASQHPASLLASSR